MNLWLIFVGFCGCVYGQGLAPFITPCRQTDFTCMKTSAQAAVPVLAQGVPELGIETMDPMNLGHVSANNAGLKMDFRRTVVKGLRNCKVEKLQRKKNEFHIVLMCSLTMKGDYTLGGKLLIMPIEGNGKYKIKIRDMQVQVWFEVGESVKGGKRYWDASRTWRYDTDVKTGAEFRFDNLFNGKNQQLSDTVHQFANSNWKDIFQEVAPPIIKVIVTKIYNEATKVFHKVPVDQLSLD